MRILWHLIGVMAVVLAGSQPCAAQLPALLPGKGMLSPAASTVPAAVEKSAGTESDTELNDAQSRLREMQESMGRLQERLNRPGLPSETSDDLLKQFNQRQRLADRYAQQIDYLKQLRVLAQQIADSRQKLDKWVPPAGNPPWPVTDGDLVRNEMSVLQARMGQLSRESSLLSEQIVTLSREKSEAEIRLRQAQEKAGGTDLAQMNGADRKLVEEAQFALAFKNAILLRADLERRVKDSERALLEVRFETAAKTWGYFDGRFMLSPEVLAKAKSDIQLLIDRDRDLEFKALERSEAAMTQLAKAQKEFQLLEKTKVPASRLAQARAALDIAQAGEAATRTEVERLRQMIELGGYWLQIWDARAEAYSEPRPDAARLAQIADRVRVGLLRAAQARDLLRQTQATKEQEAFDLREASLMAQNSLEKKVIAARLQAANVQSDAARSVLVALDKFDQFLDILQSELGVKERNQTLVERAHSAWQRIVSLSGAVWKYELFAVDDQVIADGKEVRTTRSVTVGKSIGAIGILVFGFMLFSWLIRAAIGLAERRMGLKSSVATLVRRWLTVIATGTLIVLSFNLVQIPLSVFAFLGGALAIGVGFGTQNLLKNLISGVMLLVERPIRIGDLVEVEGVRGRVTSIGIRFSTIHSSDGIDTLIPNSELVEKKLTNWTFSNPDVRREIRVGVAYGADPVAVKQLIQAAALAHPDVMQMPAPMVVLDDLGDNALIFTLRYWIRVEIGTDGRGVDSDLRCAILEKLKAVGIDVPYPQRDIRLSTLAPLSVMVEDPKNKNL